QVQRQEAIGGGEASTDLESSINSARVGGQAIADNIREPMEVAFGADFSGVKVHTDGQSDQLNRSIQARAFTTGQDVFFRSEEYNPGSRGGQELLAHELTHVVQQNGGAVMRSLFNSPQWSASPIQAKLTIGEPGDRYEQEADRVVSQVVQRINAPSSIVQYRSDSEDSQSSDESMDIDSEWEPGSEDEAQEAQDKLDDYDDIHEWSVNIPKNKYQEKTVNGSWYRFKNDSQGCLDFEDPKSTQTQPATPVNINTDVNINDNGFVWGTNQQKQLKQKKGYNYWHFWAANKKAGLGNNGVSPPGLTWHHHKDTGRMQLINRDIHAAFLHKGGKSIWGT
ncbi:DUF4157 domain-containing protein, partial [Nodularia spumigena CS-590/02]|uniref:eCIS core domain-containing protein n=1 Tax=Nodularia spumigena TaxID=70799 RepID=UPI00232AC2ED